MTRAIEVVTCLVMGANAYYYLAPLGGHPAVTRLWVVRPEEARRGHVPAAEYVPVSKDNVVVRLVQMLWHSLRLGRRPEVAALTSINPLPYGLIQLPAAKLFGKPIHFGFVGSDWYAHATGRYRRWLRPVIRSADFVTATGPAMRQQMIDYGIEEKRIAILPHAIDVENYALNDPATAKYAAIYVGRLIRRKNVELLLQAFAQVLERHPGARFCIVGDGPLEGELKELAVELSIDSAVEFAGFQAQVQPFLSQSKLLVMASSMEGLPFSIIEAMCSGVVPVSTAVGTIEDLIVNGENGLLYEQGDWQALADHIFMLLDDNAMYLELRDNALKARELYSFEAATAVWNAWFERLGDGPVPNED